MQSSQADFVGVPDSPPSTSRVSFLESSRPAGTIQDDDTKSESPELGQTLHSIPASTLGSPFNEQEQVLIRTAQDFLVRSNPPSAAQANDHGNAKQIQQIGTEKPTTPQSFTDPLLGTDLLRKPPQPKRPSLEISLGYTLHPSGTVHRAIRDVYDPINTSTENSQEHPQTPKAKRMKTSDILSSHIAAHSDHENQPHSEASPGVRSGGSGRRRSGIPDSEVNWLQTQEKSIWRPSENIYDGAIDQTKAELSARRDEEQRANEVAEEKRKEEETKDQVLQEREQIRKVTEEQEAKRKMEQVGRENEAEANRIAKEKEQQAERERKAEEQRLAKEKEDEAAEASKANDARIAKEQEEKAKQRRLEKERKKEEAKERKEQEKQEAERKENERREEKRLAKERKDKRKEQLRQAEQQRALEEAQDKAAKHAEAEAGEAVRRKAEDDEEKAKRAAKDAERKKIRKHGEPANLIKIRAEKDQNINEAKQRARGSSETRSRHSSTHLITSDNKISDGNKGSSAPINPSISHAEPLTPNKPESLITSGTPAKGTGVDTQMPLPSILRQSPSTLRRSVSFVDEPIVCPIFKTPSGSITTPAVSKSTFILPPGKTEKDLERVISGTPGFGQEKAKTSKKPREPTQKKASDGKIQSKLNIKRDVKLKGRLIDPPVQPEPPAQEEIIISSESEKSPSPYFSDPEDDPQQPGGTKAGPSSRSRSSSPSASAKARVTARMRSVSIPRPSTPEAPITKPERQKESMSDADSIQSYRSESEAGPRSKSASRSPARYVSRTPVSPSNSGSENGIKSSPPSMPKQLLEDTTIIGLTSTFTNGVDCSGDDVGKADLASLPFENGQILSQDSWATSAHPLNGTAEPQKSVHTKSIERDLEDHLQRDISRMSVEPSMFRNGSSPMLPKPKEARSMPRLPPKTTPYAANKKSSSQPRPSNSRFPSLTGLKENPPKWDFKDGAAAPMPDFMKPKPRQTPSQKTESLFMSQSSQGKVINVDDSSTESEDDTNSSDDKMDDKDGASTGRASSQGSVGKVKGRAASKYGSVLKRMWPFSSSQD